MLVTLGAFPTEGKPFSLYSEAAKGYVPAMQACGIKRMQTIFGAGYLGETIKTEFPDGGAPAPIPQIQRDMKIAYDLIIEANLDYTIWCPANFPGGEVSTSYVTKVSAPPNNRWEVTTGMVAHAIFTELQKTNEQS